ncbi:uncharacterized protein [Cardiocondyla obscurior]|uniref:uncharacterized protein n=1 Tax=Cardiocondyla obscurior TaxID=286306 RepID=UPI0039656AD9
MSKSYEALIHAQVELYGRISRAVENLRKIGAANIITGAVETRLQLLDSNWAKFEAAHDELCTSHWKEIESHANIKDGTFAEAEESYITQRTAFLDYLNEAKRTDTERDIATEAVARRQLPRIQLPEFTGKFEEWPAFKDLFQSIISKDAILGDVEKLHYLKGCLKGEAEQMVRNIPMTSENYQRVWDFLEEHFANKRLLVRACFASLTSMPKMKAEFLPDLRKLFHMMLQTVGTLEGIERPIADSDLFVHFITELLDPRSRREWETLISCTSDPPTYEELKTFLEGRLRTLEALHPVPGNFERFQQKSTSTTTSRGQRQSYIGKASPTSPEKRSSRCVLCSGPQYILSCPEFAKKGPKARRDYASFRQLCFNCFGQHRLATCPSTRSCAICGQRHHNTIHEACVSSPDSGAGGQRTTAGAKPTTTISTTPTSTQPSTTVASTQPREASVLHLRNDLSLHVTILLATARIYVKNRYGQEILVRALIDPGSEVSIISESLAQKLRLPRQPATTAIFGIGGTKSGQAHGCITLDITSSTRSAYKLKVSVFVLPRVSLNSERSVQLSNHWPRLQGLELADPNFQDSDPVEIILGAAVHAFIIEDGLRKGNRNSPVAQKTALGWILSGIATGSTLDSLAIVHLCNTKHDLAKLVMRFWQQEEVEGGAIPQTLDDIWCEKHFIKYHKRLDSGRYMASLPIREQNSNFLGSRQLSLRMLERMERNFQRKPELRVLYTRFMTEYIKLGHMSIVPPADLSNKAICYLPHHAIFKTTENNSAIRVVFNGSAQLPTGESLNDKLLCGPNLLAPLGDILNNWRCYKIALTTDIETMYRQILITESDRDYQRILWRSWPSDPICEFQLNTITYGLISAPFLAIRTLRQLAEDERVNYPCGAEILEKETYMDDILTGADTLSDAKEKLYQLIKICSAGGFVLKKWAASLPELLKTIPSVQGQGEPLEWHPAEGHSILGLHWHPVTDSFTFKVNPTADLVPTKREILSETTRLFDPLGWLGPVIVRAKILLQSFWLQKIDWDQPLLIKDQETWKIFRKELREIEEISLPRWIYTFSTDCIIELHGFSDASEKAYAAVVYIRVTTIENNDFKSRIALLQAKTKVAPVAPQGNNYNNGSKYG